MKIIQLLPVPSQQFAFTAGGQRIGLRIYSAGGRMCFDFAIDGVPLLTGCRLVAGQPLLPFEHIWPGYTLALVTDDAEPDWQLFGDGGQYLVYGEAMPDA